MPLVNVFTLNLDLKDNNYISGPVITANDNISFVINVTDDGLPFDLTNMTTASISHTRPDGVVVLKAGTKTGTNQVTFDLGSTEISVPGRVGSKVQMYDVDGKVSTLEFGYIVTEDPTGSDYIPSVDDKTLIEQVLGEGPQILADAEQATTDANAAATNANATSTNIQSAEDARVTAENTRVSQEESRVTAESDRETQEAGRVTAEDARVDAENTRVSQEASRVTEETNRDTQETGRVDAENTRVSQEASRVTEETNRDTQETGRVTAEESRVLAESSRVTAESARVTAENTRSTDEAARATAEDTRVSQEASRVTEETNRDTQETGRVSAESARVTAEDARASQEASRVTAENTRAGAEDLRETAETTRGTQETGRVTAEAARVTAENDRDTQETGRVNAESARVIAETNRDTQETGRVNAESSRASAESTRVTAESGRASAEADRASNESDRQSAETTRQSNESTRQSQETDRQNNTATAITNLNDAVDAVVHKGPYDSATAYVVNNSVLYNGSTYRAIQNTTGHPPTDGAYWTLEARAGIDGQGSVTTIVSTDGDIVVDGTDPSQPDLSISPAFKDRVTVIEDTITEAAKLTTPLTHGANLIDADQTAPLEATIYGRTLVNLLGKDGGCESSAPFTSSGTAPTASSTQKRSGSNSLNFDVSAALGIAYKDYTFPLDTSKQYFIGAWVYVESYTAGTAVLRILDVGTFNLKPYSADVDTSKVGSWQFIYFKVPTANTLVGSGFRLYFGANNASSTMVVYFDDIRLYELTSEEYDAIGTTYTTDDEIDGFVPYVDGMQSVDGAYIKQPGKNLLPPFTEWTLHPNAVVTEPYELTLNATVGAQFSELSICALAGQNYVFSAPSTDGIFICRKPRNSDGSLGEIVYDSRSDGLSKTFAVDNSYNGKIVVWLSNLSAGTFTFSEPMLVLGTAEDLPKSFVPSEPQYHFVPTTLRGLPNVVRDSYNTVTKEKFKRTEEVALDGSLDWAFHTDHTGIKRVIARPSGYPFPKQYGEGVAERFDGKRLLNRKGDTSLVEADSFFIYDETQLVIVYISDADSGWDETLNPNVNAITAIMNGWKATANDGTVYTSWVSILDGSTPATNTEAYVAANKAPGWTSWATLQYQLEDSEVEPVDAEGAITLVSGPNQVELSEGVVVREKANPVLFTDGYYYVANMAVSTDSYFENDPEKIIEVYKDGIKDDWEVFATTTFSNAQHGRGKQSAKREASEFDPTANYYVTYTRLDKYASTASVTEASATYPANIGSVVGQAVQDIAAERTRNDSQDWRATVDEAFSDNVRFDVDEHTAETSGAHGATSANTANKIVQRDSTGRFQLSDPSGPTDAATKGYVDSAIGTGTANVARTDVDNNFIGFQTFVNGLTGIDTGVSGYQWSTMSSSGGGVALFGQNCYLDTNTSEYKFRNTHPTMGARGILFQWSSADEQAQPWFFDTGSIATTSGDAFTPSPVKMQVDGAAGLFGSGDAAGPPIGDLDNIVDAGLYSADGATANKPNGNTGNWLILHMRRTNVLFVQMAINRTTNSMAIRYKNGSWSEWRNIQTDASTIPEGSDLNNFQTEGEYYCPANTSVATLTNCPTSKAFHMKVSKHAGFNQTVTEYPNNSSFRIFTRNMYGSTWGAWREIFTTGASSVEWLVDRHITILNGKDVVLQALSGTDSGDLIYRDASGVEIGRVWATSGEIWARSGPTGGGAIWTSENSAGGIGPTGWQKLASGLIIQWGWVGVPSGVTGTVNHLAFPSSSFGVQATAVSPTSGEYVIVNTASTSSASFTVKHNSASSKTIHWLAVGY